MPSEQWPTDFANVAPDVGAMPRLVAPAARVEWTSSQADWDAVVAPVVESDLPPAGVPTLGWDPASAPAATSWG
ncbi:hypothetical protein IEQ34_003733 [Dendrobium chrysotoxum]|uniref:Uncharacterized protein n=1 Tax=Dendrobium chrysotoxum TaxID=161865 RepID=A0AAV7HEA8_DENCH|nr:hypothetical protein IEQ34_003733 [Dendrobium chrysotoxum]